MLNPLIAHHYWVVVSDISGESLKSSFCIKKLKICPKKAKSIASSFNIGIQHCIVNTNCLQVQSKSTAKPEQTGYKAKHSDLHWNVQSQKFIQPLIVLEVHRDMLDLKNTTLSLIAPGIK